jgi:hypothetical protein
VRSAAAEHAIAVFADCRRFLAERAQTRLGIRFAELRTRFNQEN